MLARMTLKSGLAAGSSDQHGFTTDSNLRPHDTTVFLTTTQSQEQGQNQCTATPSIRYFYPLPQLQFKVT